MNTEYKIRHALPSDVAFVYSTWLNSYKRDSALGKSTRDTIFFNEYRFVVDYILNRPNVDVMVCCHPDEISVIFGYAVYEPGILHYVFVKEAFRRLGIAKALLTDARDAFEITTHRTSSGDLTGHTLAHNPFLLFKTLEGESK